MKKVKNTGFTLIEIAIVLIIIALLGVGAMVALRTQSQRTHTIETRTAIEEAKEALLSYVAVKNSLPCPSPIAGNGIAPVTCGGVNIQRGEVPWQTLGINAQDALGLRLRYAVAPDFTNSPITVNSSTNIIITTNPNDSAFNQNSGGTVAFALWSIGESGDGNNDRTFSTANNNAIVIPAGNDYIVSWVSRYIVLGRMVEAGQQIIVQ